MAGLVDLVMKNLRDSGSDPETLELWKSISKWHEEGGPDVVREEVAKKIKEVKSIARQQLKEKNKIMPKKKKKKTKR